MIALFGLVNLSDAEPSLATAWLHAGFVQYILDNHSVAHNFDARFSWPGFFAASATLTKLAGYSSAIPFLALAPIFYNVLVAPALWVIARRVTGSDRLAWVSLILYFCMNWYEQDYFSPQATAFVLYIAVLAFLFAEAPPSEVADGSRRSRLQSILRTPGRAPDVSGGIALAREATLVVISGAIVVTHQLTPVTLVMAMALFALTGMTRYRLLWLLTTVVFVSWFSFGAEDYWRGNLGVLFGDLGKIGSTVHSSVGTRLGGDVVHQRLQDVRLAASGGLFLIAMFGAWSIRKRRGSFLFACLALAPFSIIAMQSYGGEVILRTFVYSSPLLAPLATVALRRVVRFGGRPAIIPVVAISVAVASLVLTTTRGVNVAFERVTSKEVAASNYLFARMPSGSSLAILEEVGPLGFDRLTEWKPVSLGSDVCTVPAVQCAAIQKPDYVVVTISQEALGHLVEGRPTGWTAQIVAQLIATGTYKEIYGNSDAQVLQRVKSGE